jgi:hypothetical protein
MANKKNYDNRTLLQIALVAGIASNDLDGWGWLVFILLFTL